MPSKFVVSILGHSNLLFDGGSNPKNPSTVPEACEKNNVEVSRLLASMKGTLGDMQLSYNYCNQVMKTHGKNVCLSFLSISYFFRVVNYEYYEETG